MTFSRPQIAAQLESAGLSPKRSRGQNFVVDPNTVRRIARLADVGIGDRVLEIGAGLGSLTLALAETGATVRAVEIDPELVPLLRSNCAGLGNVTVIEGDAMSLDWDAVLAPHDDWMLVANLPYNVATPLIADLLDDEPRITRMLVMIQREVAERLVARVGDGAYGAVSVKVDYWAESSIVGHVPAAVFLPRPKVESSLVSIVRRPRPPVESDDPIAPAGLFALVRAGFAKRRKMLRGALAGIVTGEQFAAAGIDPTSRAEELSTADWVRLARAVGGSSRGEGL